MTPLDGFEINQAMSDDGASVLDAANWRRLSDKILAAFSHAYATGEASIAERLRDALSENERHGQERFRAEKRNGITPLQRAELWVAFVNARNGYRQACDAGEPGSPAADASLAIMKDAYLRWSAA